MLRLGGYVMTPGRFFFLIALFVSLSSRCFSQSSSPQNAPASRSNSTVSVDELAMPHKAARAFQKGAELLVKGDAQASLPYFQEAIKHAPSSFRPYHNLGLAYYRLGQLDAAAQNFQKSIDLSKGAFAPSLFGLSMIFYRQADFPSAESLIRQGLLVAPGSGVGKYCLGLVQFSLGRTADSERSAREALALDPSETDAYVLLAHIHERLHDPAAVLNDVHSYLQRDPPGALQPDALDLLHRAQLNLSRLSASVN